MVQSERKDVSLSYWFPRIAIVVGSSLANAIFHVMKLYLCIKVTIHIPSREFSEEDPFADSDSIKLGIYKFKRHNIWILVYVPFPRRRLNSVR